MRHRDRFRASASVLFLALAALLPHAAEAQASSEYRAHLSLVPVDAFASARTSGVGEAFAVLEGDVLTVTATFQGLASPATEATVREARPGFRGPVIFELEVPAVRMGELTGRVTLDAEQAASLREAHLYLKIHTETNPDGAIRGWFYPREGGQ